MSFVMIPVLILGGIYLAYQIFGLVYALIRKKKEQGRVGKVHEHSSTD